MRLSRDRDVYKTVPRVRADYPSFGVTFYGLLGLDYLNSKGERYIKLSAHPITNVQRHLEVSWKYLLSNGNKHDFDKSLASSLKAVLVPILAPSESQKKLNACKTRWWRPITTTSSHSHIYTPPIKPLLYNPSEWVIRDALIACYFTATTVSYTKWSRPSSSPRRPASSTFPHIFPPPCTPSCIHCS